MKVKMKTTTNWKGKLRKPGDTLTVDEKVAKRWERNGIAVITDKKSGKKKQEDSGKEQDGLENLTVEELQKLAEEKGIAPGNMKKEDLITAIQG